MSKRIEVINAVKNDLAKGDIRSSLEHLAEYFAGEGVAYRSLQRTTFQIQASYGRLRQDIQRGLLSNEQEELAKNQVTDRILELVEELERAPSPTRMQMQRRVPWILVGVLILGGLIFALWPKDPQPPKPLPSPAGCPNYQATSDFNVLVLPFEALSDAPKKYPSRIVRSDLGSFADRTNINTQIVVVQEPDSIGLPYPSGASGAEQIGKRCGADLVIWGSYEVHSNQTIVMLRYAFVNIDGRFPLVQLAAVGEESIDTVKTISSIASEGVLTQDIKTSMQLLFGMIATQLDDQEAAIITLKESLTQDTTLQGIRMELLAHNYLLAHQYDSAAASYDVLLRSEPDHVLALNNRGMIHMMAKQYERAAQDLQRVQELGPDDAGLLAVLGKAYYESGALKRAASSMQRAAALAPDAHHIQQQIAMVAAAQREAVAQKRLAEQKLTDNPSDQVALEDYAVSTLKLGDSKSAEKAAERMVAAAPSEPVGYEIKIRAELEENNVEGVRETVSKAVKNGISKDTLLQRIPSLEKFFDPPPAPKEKKDNRSRQ